ncbi:MAG: HAD family hydrolase [Candidatus Aenigmarchaeota archaeon]|nr:HAD family hydrolase [Candidatus Aenigmarchaeota archaeon]
MKRVFDLVIFDLDGTLIDARRNIKKNINYTLSLNGYEKLKNNKIYTLMGYPLIDIFRTILPEKYAHVAVKLVKDYRKRYIKTCHKGVKILPGVKRTLAILKKDGYKLAVSTAKGESQTKLLLKRLGLHRYFDLIIGYGYGHSNLRPKPHPDMILHIIKRLKIDKRKAIMIGDTQLDVHAGRNADVYTIAVKSGVRLGIAKMKKLKTAKPDAIIKSVKELPGYLRKKGMI